MTDQDRAVAWLDAHPETEKVVAADWSAWWTEHDMDDLLSPEVREECAVATARRCLVAFLTTPLPCAFCEGMGLTFTGAYEWDGARLYSSPDCVECNGSGTAGILLDQLEARYEQVGWRRKYLPPYAHLGVGFSTDEGVDDPLVKKEPVFRKLPSPEEE